jgi:hypothetical protein
MARQMVLDGVADQLAQHVGLDGVDFDGWLVRYGWALDWQQYYKGRLLFGIWIDADLSRLMKQRDAALSNILDALTQRQRPVVRAIRSAASVGPSCTIPLTRRRWQSLRRTCRPSPNCGGWRSANRARPEGPRLSLMPLTYRPEPRLLKCDETGMKPFSGFHEAMVKPLAIRKGKSDGPRGAA